MKPNVLAMAGFLAMSLPATTVVFNLDCALGTTQCTALPEVVGTVTVTDIPGGVAVNVAMNYGTTCKDFYCNIVGRAVLMLPALYAADGFQLAPYGGYFDVGTSNIGFVIYRDVTEASFLAKDSLGLVYGGVHLQDITCEAAGFFASNDLLKVGATLYDPPEIPEPATFWVVGLGLPAVSLMRRRGPFVLARRRGPGTPKWVYSTK